MKRLTQMLLIGLGFGLLVAVLGVLTNRPAPAQAPRPSVPVTVTNTTARPVPTTALGTTTVSGSVIAAQSTTPWSVRAVQDGPWRVSNPLNPNTGTQLPLIVQDVDNPGHNPFSVNASCPSSGQCVAVATLPTTTADGSPVKTGVIEFVSAICNGLALGITQDNFNFIYRLNGQAQAVYFPAVVENGTGRMAMRTVIYADPAFGVQLGTPGNNSGCFVSISGHLIPQ